MNRSVVLLVALALPVSSVHAELPSSLGEAWDKARSALDSVTRQDAPPPVLAGQPPGPELDAARFQQVWRSILDKLDEGAKVEEKIITAPDSALFAKDKGNYRKELSGILDDALEILQDETLARLRRQHEVIKERSAQAAARILEHRENRVTAPVNGAADTTRAAFDKKIAEEEETIARHEEDLRQIKRGFQQRLAQLGVKLTEEQVVALISRVDYYDIVQMAAVFDILKQITAQLLELSRASGEEIASARKYYGMHVVLLELVMHMQTRYVETVDQRYLPKITEIIDRTVALQKSSRAQLAGEQDAHRRTVYEKNIQAQQLTLKAARLYLDNLSEQRSKVIKARETVRKDYNLAFNTFETVKVSAELLGLLRNGKESYDTLMRLQIPEIVPFENLEMRKKYEELTQLIGQS